METDKCAALITVLECGNIHAAAEKMGYTPSGVSRMMASLESELGVSLLVRGKQGVSPTAVCAALLDDIAEVCSAGARLRESAQNLTGLLAGTLRIGTAYPRFNGPLTRALSEYHKRHPRVIIELHEGNSTPLVDRLVQGSLDYCLVSRREGGFHWHSLTEDELVALVPPDNEAVTDGVYALDRFAHDPFIEIGAHEKTDNYLALSALGIRPNICYSVSLDRTAYSLVDEGLGVTLTNSAHVDLLSGTAKTLPTEPAISIEIGVAMVRDNAASPAAKAFKPLLLEALETGSSHVGVTTRG